MDLKMHQGREYAVLPIIALTHGAISARGSDGYELVAPEHYGQNVNAWDGKPLFLGHPTSRATSDVVDRDGLGFVKGARLDDQQRLIMEAWVDLMHAKLRAPALLDRLRAQEPIQVSVGVDIDLADAEGEIGGRGYAGAWTNIRPDHLALLPTDVAGACNWEMGCGVREAKRASRRSTVSKGFYARFYQRPVCDGAKRTEEIDLDEGASDQRFVAASAAAEWDLNEEEDQY
jgi:hypothetical protein